VVRTGRDPRPASDDAANGLCLLADFALFGVRAHSKFWTKNLTENGLTDFCETPNLFDMRQATWKILNRGRVPKQTRQIFFTCLKCGHDAVLPVLGIPMAQIGQGIVFDIGDYAMPKIIECRKCRRRYQLESNGSCTEKSMNALLQDQ
jgi:hypothetical protein